MNLLKNGLFTLLALTAVLFTSCEKDDCVPPDLAENIVGEWRVQLSAGDVEFQADGTLIDPDDTLIGGESNGNPFDQKSWTVDGTTLTLTAMTSVGSASFSSDFEVTQNECDEIKFEILGFTETMKRK